MSRLIEELLAELKAELNIKDEQLKNLQTFIKRQKNLLKKYYKEKLILFQKFTGTKHLLKKLKKIMTFKVQKKLDINN